MRSAPSARAGPHSRTPDLSSSPWLSPRRRARVADGGPAGGRGPGGRERWLDLCAGPGGKVGLLAAPAAERGADLVANEVAPHRADLVARTLVPAAPRGRAISGSLRGADRDGPGGRGVEPAAYDRILVDAPCTGLGATTAPGGAVAPHTGSRQSGVLQRALLTSAPLRSRRGSSPTRRAAPTSPKRPSSSRTSQTPPRRVNSVGRSPVVAEVTDGWAEALEGRPGGPILWPHVHGTDGMFPRPCCGAAGDLRGSPSQVYGMARVRRALPLTLSLRHPGAGPGPGEKLHEDHAELGSSPPPGH